MTGRRTASALLLIFACLPGVASAQIYIGGGDAPRRGSVEVAGGGTFSRGFDLGRNAADLTTSTPAGRFDLFSADARISGFPGAFGTVGYYVTDRVVLEGSVRYARPRLSVRLTGDAEGAPDITASETVGHYVFGGSLAWHMASGGRARPFLAVGAGHLRELHEGNQLVETGLEYHALAGLKYWLGAGSRRLGLRVEAGLSGRQEGADPGEDRRFLPLVRGGLSYLF